MNSHASDAPLSGGKLILAGLALALTNFMVVLDTSIANVSVAHISGSLGISSSQGTWVITSYAVAEAICVPLTGWLASRFGTVRTFVSGVVGFGIFSVLCGMATSLTMLVACRIGQGFFGGPLMPLSQTLLLRIFPKKQHGQAMGLWAMTTVTAPILGPILGGLISDNSSWHWIFFINIPVAIVCAIGAQNLLKGHETKTEAIGVDKIGLALLVVWVSAFQLVLDLGREHDWFEDTFIIMMSVTAAIALIFFVVWEVTDHRPIVDLSVFRHRGFTISVISLSFAFGAFFASAVLIPSYVQSHLGYTSTYAGYVTAFTGVGAVIMSPIVAKLLDKIDPRQMVFGGILWMGLTTLPRLSWTAEADFWTLAIPQLLQGFGLPFFFVPLTVIGLAAVTEEETASAAGVMSFLRTLAGAIGTSIATTMYHNNAVVARSEIVSKTTEAESLEYLNADGSSIDSARSMFEQLVVTEAYGLAVNHVFLLSAIVFAFSAAIIWLAPRPSRAVDTTAAH